ncbi:hypothetical protein MSAN_00435700 [Mycena sanguinolenta]|uniref:F-box domain-containing protein n=1 Tax=Mycena sanguinolenta TaxID=230812 RepID=A0A8H7DJE2_9AGAR|nr:hypothetical protein MSAN_00435700 [Mycena sanguinolenta]
MEVVDNPNPQMLVVPTLRRLIFGETTNTDDYILHYLTLPALQTLSLPMRYISGEELVACVQRSAAPLRDLALRWQSHNISLLHLNLHDCLRLIPTLTRFRMWRPRSDVVTELFIALAESSSFLPNLHDLTINILDTAHSPADISDSFWRDLVRALSNRHIDRLYIASVNKSPPQDVLDSLRELVAAGANIHTGTEQFNFVAA